MSTIVLYRSKTGFTEQYAQWIAKALYCKAVPYEDRDSVDLADYDTILFGDNLHMGRLPGLGWLGKQLEKLPGKRTAVFAVGASEADMPKLPATLAANFQGPVWDGVEVFYLRGGLRYDRMGVMDRILMAGLRGTLRREAGENSPMYKTVAKSFDAAAHKNIAPIVNWAKA